jgi:hypothetical protein
MSRPRLSADGRFVSYGLGDDFLAPTRGEIYDTETGVITRLGPANAVSAVTSGIVAFESSRLRRSPLDTDIFTAPIAVP